MAQTLYRWRKPEFVHTWTGATSEALDWSYYLVALIWWVQSLALPPIQLVSLGLASQVVFLVMEVPSGVISDLLSRKTTLVLSRILMGMSFLLMVSTKSYWLLLGVQGMGGLAWTLRSGADVAWLTDELGVSGDVDEQDIGDEVERILLRRHRLGLLLAVVGIVITVLIGMRSLELAIRLTGVGHLIVAIITMLIMTEHGFEGGRQRGKTFVSIFREGAATVRSRPRLRRILLVATGVALGGSALDLLGLNQFLDATATSGSSIVLMGGWFLAAACAGYGVNIVVTRQIGLATDLSRITAVMLLVTAVGIGVAAGFDFWVIVGLGLMIQDSMRETFFVILESWVNRETSSDVRATVHSMVSQSQSVAEIVGGLIWGLIAQFLSIPTALLGIAFVIAGVAWLADSVPTTRTKKPGVTSDVG